MGPTANWKSLYFASLEFGQNMERKNFNLEHDIGYTLNFEMNFLKIISQTFVQENAVTSFFYWHKFISRKKKS